MAKTRSKNNKNQTLLDQYNIKPESKQIKKEQKTQIQQKQLKNDRQVKLVMHKFAHFQPQGIEKMVLTKDKSLIGLARSNHSIEIWKSFSFIQLIIVPGHKNIDIRNLHWLEKDFDKQNIKSFQETDKNPLYYQTQKNRKIIFKKRRLVSTGLNGMVIEWDLCLNKPKSKYLCPGGAIWNSQLIEKFLYLACEDGAIRILKIKKKQIEFLKQFSKSESPCLCISTIHQSNQKYKNQQKKNYVSSDDDKILEKYDEPENLIGPQRFAYVSYMDSSIKKWDLLTGNCVLHIQVQNKNEAQKNGAVYLMCLKTFMNYLISGDSQGNICFWDSQFGTLVKKISQLKQDILSIETCEETMSVYATGIDSNVIHIQLSNQNEDSLNDIILTSIFRGQSHDIKSLIILNPKTLLSGGITTDICVYKLENSGRFRDQFGVNSIQEQKAEKVRHIPPFPFKQISKIAFNIQKNKEQDNVLVIQNGDNFNLDLYKVKTKEILMKIEKSGDFGIQAFEMNGEWLAYSDCLNTMVLKFDFNKLEISPFSKIISDSILKSNQDELLKIFSGRKLPSAKFVQIYQIDIEKPEYNLVILTNEWVFLDIDLQTFQLIKISDLKEICQKIFVLQSYEYDSDKLRHYDQIINWFFYDKTFKILSFNCLKNGSTTFIIDLMSSSQCYKVPCISNEYGKVQVPLCFEISPNGETGVLTYENNMIQVINLLNQCVHKWSISNVELFSNQFLSRYNRLTGITAISDKQFIVYSNYTWSILDLDQDLNNENQIQNVQTKKNIFMDPNSSWFENLKTCQNRYIRQISISSFGNRSQIFNESFVKSEDKQKNLAINTNIKGILGIQLDKFQSSNEQPQLIVIQNQWRKVMEQMQGVAATKTKFGK